MITDDAKCALSKRMPVVNSQTTTTPVLTRKLSPRGSGTWKTNGKLPSAKKIAPTHTPPQIQNRSNAGPRIHFTVGCRYNNSTTALALAY